MLRLVFLSCAVAMTTVSFVLLLHALASPHWVAVCLPLSAVVMAPEKHQSPPPLPPSTMLKAAPGDHAEGEKRPPPTDDYLLEKKLLKDQLQKQNICLSQGFFHYCVTGNGLFGIAGYKLCISTNAPDRAWKESEKASVAAIVFSLFSCVVIIALIIISMRAAHHSSSHTRFHNMYSNVAAIMSFLTGSVVLLSLLPLAAQALSRAPDGTAFFNEMVDRVATAHAFVMRVDWAAKKAEVTEAQTWARNVVGHMSGLVLGRDFHLALVAGGLLYVSCSLLMFRPGPEPERYPSPYRPEHKRS